MKNKIISKLEYIIVFFILLSIGFYINRNIIIKGLYMDDLYAWSYIPYTNFFTYSFKFYENATRYRPFYYILQYFIFKIVGTNINLIVPINIFFHSIVGIFVYFFSKKINAGIFISLLISIIYEISHFSYYQIGQAIGIIETQSQLIALFILYLSILYIKNNNKYSKYCFVLMCIFLFVISFTHERYVGLVAVICFSIIFKNVLFIDESAILKNRLIKHKIINIFKQLLIVFLVVLLIIIIRYLATGKIIPAGTGGSIVEETFNIETAFKYAIDQVKFIFGMNIGEEYLVGKSFENCSGIIKMLTYFSIIMIFVIVFIYFVIKIVSVIKNFKTNHNKVLSIYQSFYVDILFLIFIAMCIAQSSVTIRVEMRFVYTSFTASLLYFSYMISELLDLLKEKQYYKQIYNLIFTLFIAFFLSRGIVEIYYRSFYHNIYFFSDSKRINSLITETIEKHGKNKILDSNTHIYILLNQYKMTDFYAEYLFKIYDKTYKGNKILFINDLSELPIDANIDNTYVYIEDYANNGYLEYPLSDFLNNRNK